MMAVKIQKLHYIDVTFKGNKNIFKCFFLLWFIQNILYFHINLLFKLSWLTNICCVNYTATKVWWLKVNIINIYKRDVKSPHENHDNAYRGIRWMCGWWLVVPEPLILCLCTPQHQPRTYNFRNLILRHTVTLQMMPPVSKHSAVWDSLNSYLSWGS